MMRSSARETLTIRGLLVARVTLDTTIVAGGRVAREPALTRAAARTYARPAKPNAIPAGLPVSFLPPLGLPTLLPPSSPSPRRVERARQIPGRRRMAAVELDYHKPRRRRRVGPRELWVGIALWIVIAVLLTVVACVLFAGRNDPATWR